MWYRGRRLLPRCGARFGACTKPFKPCGRDALVISMANTSDLRGALERGVKGLREGLTEVLTEAEAASRIALLKVETLNLENDRDRVLRELGRAVYERMTHAPEAVTIHLESDLQGLLVEARRIHDEMSAKQRERDALRAKLGWTGRGGSGGSGDTPPPPPSSADEAARAGGSAQAP